MREYVATAKTVEEAIQLGCEALSVDRDDLGVSYEILEMPQKTGFLGLKVTPAKVKLPWKLPIPSRKPRLLPRWPLLNPNPPRQKKRPNNPRQRMLPRRKPRPRWILPLTPACRLRWIT
ncbi:MAG: Jag N-terminal domain-containing protein [Subdoligranulum sp.]